jgi:hypothetical protein
MRYFLISHLAASVVLLLPRPSLRICCWPPAAIMAAKPCRQRARRNNGPGAPRDIALDVSASGSFQSGSVLTIDANSSVTSGPTQSPSR